MAEPKSTRKRCRRQIVFEGTGIQKNGSFNKPPSPKASQCQSPSVLSATNLRSVSPRTYLRVSPSPFRNSPVSHRRHSVPAFHMTVSSLNEQQNNLNFVPNGDYDEEESGSVEIYDEEEVEREEETDEDYESALSCSSLFQGSVSTCKYTFNMTRTTRLNIAR